MGLLGKMVLLIITLITLAWWIHTCIVDTTTKYVINRELIDLSDETSNRKLKLEKGLGELHARVLGILCSGREINDLNIVKESRQLINKEGSTSGLEPPVIVSRRDIHDSDRDGAEKTIPQWAALKTYWGELRVWMQSFEERNAAVTTNDTLWTHLRWRSIQVGTDDLDDKFAVQRFFRNQRCSITMVVPLLKHQVPPGPKPAQPAKVPPPENKVDPAIADVRFAVIEVDISHLLAEVLSHSRSFAVLVEPTAKFTPVLMPHGPPNFAPEPLGQRFVDKLTEIAKEYRTDTDVQDSGKRVPAIYNGTEADWFTFSELFPMGLKAPLYVESKTLSSEVVKLLNYDPPGAVQNKFSRLVDRGSKDGDPLRAIDGASESVPRVRLRASHADALETLKREVSECADGNIHWSEELPMVHFAIDLQVITAPGMPSMSAEAHRQSGSAAAKLPPQPVMYLIRAAAKEEIAGAVTADLGNLQRWSTLGRFLALAAALCLAEYFTRPLRSMAGTAHAIGQLDLTTERGHQRARELLQSLPTARSDETGRLAERLGRMIEQILLANDCLRGQQVELQQAKDNLDLQVQLKTRELAAEVHRANEANQAKSLFLASISHDMRTPMHVIHTQSDLLQRFKTEEKRTGAIQLIVKNARRLSFLIDDILDYQRLISGVIDLKINETDVRSLLLELTNDFQEAAAERNNLLIMRCDLPCRIRVDRSRLERVLVNLLSNACKFTRGGTIELSTHSVDDERIEFRVRDEGQGMTAQQQAHVFQPMMKSRQQGAEGTGLGLFICKGLVERMGGSISFESDGGKGTTFHVTLPLNFAGEAPGVSAVPAPPIIVVPPLHPPKSSSGLHQTGILPLALVIDDDEAARNVLSNMLQELGYQTATAAGGRRGLELAAETRPDLITLDVIMPDISGWEVLTQLKHNPLTQDIPVIVVTVLADQETGNILGADGFLIKPSNLASLSSAVKNALRMRGLEEGEILLVDDDPECRRDLRKLLESCGWRVAEACDGHDALDRINRRMPDLAIIDLNMPNMDGFTLIESLRGKSGTEELPIIVLSAVALNEADRQRLQTETSRYFGKASLDLAKLNSEIARLIERHRRSERPATPALTNVIVRK